MNKPCTENRNDKLLNILSVYGIENIPQGAEDNIDIDKTGNVIVAHSTDVKKNWTNIYRYKNIIKVLHTKYWNEGYFNTNSDSQELSKLPNMFCVGSDLVEKNIKSFINAIITNEPNPYYKLIGFNPDLEELLSRRLESDRSGKKHENYDADFATIKNILLIPKS